MKVALITPSNLSHMPYVRNYLDILKKKGTDYELYNWDRLHTEIDSNYTYKDKKIGIKKNFKDYYFYSRYLRKKLHENDYDVIIIFGLQLSFFLSSIIYNKYKNKYILDIRDKHSIIQFINLKKLINYSLCNVISSEKYKDWLPESSYKVNHNTSLGTNIKEISKIKKDDLYFNINNFQIMTIGTIRDYEINKRLLEALANNSRYKISYVGDGEIKCKLEEFCEYNQIDNVCFQGRYHANEEKNIIEKASIISVLRYNDSENNRTALPNRLYAALQSGKILLAYKGTYLSDLISKYNLGLVIESFENLDNQIKKYIEEFDYSEYINGREIFLKKVLNENIEFINAIEDILREE